MERKCMCVGLTFPEVSLWCVVIDEVEGAVVR